MKRRLIYLIISLIVIGAFTAGSYFLYFNVSNGSLIYSIDMIQENLAETADIKIAGDLLLANKKNLTAGYNWSKVEAIAANLANQLGSLSYSDPRLDEYKKNATVWTVKIREAAKDPKTWKNVPADPGNFTVALRDGEAEALYNHSLAKIFELNLYGSDAVRRKDRETMRYLAAKLLVQEHWLSGLANYKKAKIFSQLIKPSYALASSLNKVKDEYERVRAAVLALKIFALEYSAADNNEKSKTAVGDWNKLAEDWAKVIAENDLAPQVLAELVKNAARQSPEQLFIEEWVKAAAHSDLAPQVLAELVKNAAKQPPPQIQGFKDNCLASGGKLGGVNRNNGWIPTSADGYYCNFKEQDKDCWNFLSYTGDFSAGGVSGCVIQNVLDQATGPNLAAVKTKAGIETPAQTTAGQIQTPTEVNAGGKTPTQTTKTQTQTPKTPTKIPLRDLGTPAGTAAPKIEFTLSQTNFTATVGDNFSYSFCEPAVSRGSDLCTAASTNPRYGLPPYSFSLDSGGFLPLGLTLNLNGLLVGTPTAAGNRTVGICAKDSGGFSVCRNITINVGSAKNQPETWQGTVETSGRCICSHAPGSNNCYSNDGTLAGSFTFTFTFPGSLVQAMKSSDLYAPDHPGSGNGTFSGAETVATQAPDNYLDKCKLIGDSAASVPFTVTARAIYAGTTNPDYAGSAAEVDLSAGGSESHEWLMPGRVSDTSGYAGQISVMYLIIPSISDTQMSGKILFTPPGRGTFTLTRVK